MTEDEVWQELGRRVRLLRRWRGVSQAVLATRLRMTRVSVTNLEAGRQKMPVWGLIKVSEALSVPPHVWLLIPAEWQAWCEAERVTEKQTLTELVPITIYKRKSKMIEVESS